MTIRRRLLISHLVMFATPVLMLLITMATVSVGLFAFIQSGNHVYLESSDQFTRAADILYNAVFHGKRSEADMESDASYGWLVRVVSPSHNYIVIYRDQEKEPLYEYGNRELTLMFPRMPGRESLREVSNPDRGAFMLVRDNEYLMIRKRTVGKTPYYLYFICYQAPHGTDDRLEQVSRWTFRFLGVALLAFLGLTSWFLSEFMIRRILPPLRALKKGARRVEQGDLSVRLHHEGRDEFTPVFQSFNTMTQALEDLIRQHEEDEKRRKELIASISHDIRTPLTVIRAYVEGLSDGVAKTEEKRAHYLAVIRQKSEELDEMVDQLFNLSKMDIGNRAVPMERLDLAEMAARFADENRESLLRHGMEVGVRADGPCWIAGNTLLLRRILLNLMSNSLKYMDRETGRFTLSAERADGGIRLSVADDGPGVPEEDLPHLFEAFYRSDKARTKTGNGSGLGLAIVARAMELMGGTAAAQNGQPSGLVIILTWPEARRKQGDEALMDS